jgi:CRP/FNR family transcriptional regulator, cyclic AMP receptor protein
MKLPQSSEFEREFEDGHLVCREGERSQEMFVIQSGGVRIFKSTLRGELELARLSRGDFFGEMSVLESLPRDASAQALGKTRVLVMTAGALLVRLRRDPTFAFELLRRLSGRVRSLNARLVEVTGNEEEDEPRRGSMLYTAAEAPVVAALPAPLAASK